MTAPINNENLYYLILQAIGTRFDATGLIAEITGGLHNNRYQEGDPTPYACFSHLGTTPDSRSKSGTTLGTKYSITVIEYNVWATSRLTAIRLCSKLAGRMEYANLSLPGIRVQQSREISANDREEDRDLFVASITHEIHWSQSINTEQE